MCVDMYKRCDGLFDCPDESDEFICENIEIYETIYKKEIPPFKHGSKVDIYVSVFLLNINRIVLPTTFDAKIQLVLRWQDYRLTFKDLQSDGNTVSMEIRKKLWIPPLTFSNTKEGALLKCAMVLKRRMFVSCKMAFPSFCFQILPIWLHKIYRIQIEITRSQCPSCFCTYLPLQKNYLKSTD